MLMLPLALSFCSQPVPRTVPHFVVSALMSTLCPVESSLLSRSSQTRFCVRLPVLFVIHAGTLCLLTKLLAYDGRRGK
jgi:hypothetical protein